MSLLAQYIVDILPDGGPKYFETNLEQFIAEPFNFASAILFIGLTLYWLYRLKGEYKSQMFLTVSTIVLGIGAVGGTIYHGFRIAAFYMYMDWLPILALCMAASIYFLVKMYDSYKQALIVLVIFIALQVVIVSSFGDHNGTNISYGVLAAYILFPTFLLLRKNKFKHWQYIAYALLCFAIALTCRALDPWGYLPMGTHFLWHTFGAGATHFMFMFVYHISKKKEKDLAQA